MHPNRHCMCACASARVYVCRAMKSMAPERYRKAYGETSLQQRGGHHAAMYIVKWRAACAWRNRSVLGISSSAGARLAAKPAWIRRGVVAICSLGGFISASCALSPSRVCWCVYARGERICAREVSEGAREIWRGVAEKKSGEKKEEKATRREISPTSKAKRQ